VSKILTGLTVDDHLKILALIQIDRGDVDVTRQRQRAKTSQAHSKQSDSAHRASNPTEENHNSHVIYDDTKSRL
jgi:hypothetical protein